MIEIEIGEGQKQVLKQHKKSIDLFYILGQGKSLQTLLNLIAKVVKCTILKLL